MLRDCLGIGIFVGRVPFMTRKTTAFLIVAIAMLAASPANAYCILNKTTDTLYASLDDYHPLGDFDVELKPGGRVCCDWFDRRCNPTGNRGALVSIKIEGLENRKKWKEAASKKIKNRRKGRTVKSVVNSLGIPKNFAALYCIDGLKRSVRASAGGTVTLTRSFSNPGKLKCTSYDQFLRPVNALTRQSKSGPRLIVAPPTSAKPRDFPDLSEELMR